MFIKIKPLEKNYTSSSLKERFSKEVLEKSNGGDSVSALMNEEYAEEAEITSFTDDDVSSHSSVAAVSTSFEFTPKLEKREPDGPIQKTNMNDKEHHLASQTRLGNLHMVQQDPYKKLESSSYMSSVNCHASMSNLRIVIRCQHKKNVISPGADSSSPSSVCEKLDVNSRSRTRSSDLENLDENIHEKDAPSRKIIEDFQRISNIRAFNIYSRHTSPQESSHFIGKNSDSISCDTCECNDKLNGRIKEDDKYFLKEAGGDQIYYGSIENMHGNEKSNLDRQNCMEDDQSVAQGLSRHTRAAHLTVEF